MKVHSNAWPTAKKGLVALSCATALTSFGLFAKPVAADELASNTDEPITASSDSVETIEVTETPVNTSQEAEGVIIHEDPVVTSETEPAVATTTTTINDPETGTSAFRRVQVISGGREIVINDGTDAQANTDSQGYYSDDQGNWYYKDASGNNLTGAQTIDGQQVYFRENGQQVKGALANSNGYLERYYDVDSGDLWTNRYVQFNNNWYYLGNDGKPVKGAQTINGQEVYFHPTHAFQIKGDFQGYFSPVSTDGAYYDGQTGSKVTKAGFVQRQDGDWFYLDNEGNKLTGLHTIDGKLYYFTASGASMSVQYGRQDKGQIEYFENNATTARVYGYSPYANITQIYYFDENTGEAVRNRYVQYGSSWYYFGDDANAVRGEAVIQNQVVYFHPDGRQAKGELVNVNGSLHYYDADSGARVSNATLTINGKTYQFDADGKGTTL